MTAYTEEHVERARECVNRADQSTRAKLRAYLDLGDLLCEVSPPSGKKANDGSHQALKAFCSDERVERAGIALEAARKYRDVAAWFCGTMRERILTSQVTVSYSTVRTVYTRGKNIPLEKRNDILLDVLEEAEQLGQNRLDRDVVAQRLGMAATSSSPKSATMSPKRIEDLATNTEVRAKIWETATDEEIATIPSVRAKIAEETTPEQIEAAILSTPAEPVPVNPPRSKANTPHGIDEDALVEDVTIHVENARMDTLRAITKIGHDPNLFATRDLTRILHAARSTLEYMAKIEKIAASSTPLTEQGLEQLLNNPGNSH